MRPKMEIFVVPSPPPPPGPVAAGRVWGPPDRNDVKIAVFVKDSTQNRKFSGAH